MLIFFLLVLVRKYFEGNKNIEHLANVESYFLCSDFLVLGKKEEPSRKFIIFVVLSSQLDPKLLKNSVSPRNPIQKSLYDLRIIDPMLGSLPVNIAGMVLCMVSCAQIRTINSQVNGYGFV